MADPNQHTDQQLQEFIKYFDRMQKEATPEDYKNMLRDVRDTCEIRLEAIGVDVKKNNWWSKIFGNK